MKPNKELFAESRCFASHLMDADWTAEWSALQALRRCMPDVAFWDERAKSFSSKDTPEGYVEEFLHRANVRSGESVFDMGCGTGDLAVPLAEAGINVVAADFSEGMLGVLGERARRLGLSNVRSVQMGWEDDWAACGLRPGSFDVCLASRSLSVSDLEEALLKLDALARRRVCITVATGLSPRTDGRVMAALGFKSAIVPDYLYAVLTLAQHGIRAEVSFIDSERVDYFEDFDEAYGYYSRMVEESVPFESRERLDAALADLREWLPGQLVECEADEGLEGSGCGSEGDERGAEGYDARSSCETERGTKLRKLLRMREPRIISWAFLSWDK